MWTRPRLWKKKPFPSRIDCVCVCVSIAGPYSGHWACLSLASIKLSQSLQHKPCPLSRLPGTDDSFWVSLWISAEALCWNFSWAPLNLQIDLRTALTRVKLSIIWDFKNFSQHHFADFCEEVFVPLLLGHFQFLLIMFCRFLLKFMCLFG